MSQGTTYSKIAVFTMNADNTWNRLSVEAEAKRAPKVVIRSTGIQQKVQDTPVKLPEAVKRPYINSVGLYSVRQSEERKRALLEQIRATRAEIRGIVTNKHPDPNTVIYRLDRKTTQKAKRAIQAWNTICKMVDNLFNPVTCQYSQVKSYKTQLS